MCVRSLTSFLDLRLGVAPGSVHVLLPPARVAASEPCWEMSAGCNPHEYDAVFTSKYARKTAKKLRRSGLDETAGRMVDVLANHGHLPSRQARTHCGSSRGQCTRSGSECCRWSLLSGVDERNGSSGSLEGSVLGIDLEGGAGLGELDRHPYVSDVLLQSW
jgi:hypothetical protein